MESDEKVDFRLVLKQMTCPFVVKITVTNSPSQVVIAFETHMQQPDIASA
jgi:hypothetical protein